MAQRVKNPPARQETWVQSLSQDDPLEKEMVTHSWRILWRGAWWATVHEITKNRTKQLTHTHNLGLGFYFWIVILIAKSITLFFASFSRYGFYLERDSFGNFCPFGVSLFYLLYDLTFICL